MNRVQQRLAEQREMPFREPSRRERELTGILRRIDAQLQANPVPAPEKGSLS